MAIPNYSGAKEAAKKFIAFYYSDAGLEICEQYSGMMLPVSYSDGIYRKLTTDNLSTFVKSTIKIGEECQRIYKAVNGKLLYDGGIQALTYYTPVSSFTYGNDQMTVDQFCAMENSYWEGEWNNILINADLAD